MNSVIRYAHTPCTANGSAAAIASIAARSSPTARITPPSRGFLRPEAMKTPAAYCSSSHVTCSAISASARSTGAV